MTPTPKLNVPLSAAECSNALDKIAERLGMSIPHGQRQRFEDVIMAADAAGREVMALPDDIPSVDLARFPRTNIHIPSLSDPDFTAAWACKAEIGGGGDGLLAGKTVCIKDNIYVAGVHMSLSSRAIKAFVQAGDKVMGKAACQAFTLGGLSFLSASGIIRNPLSPYHTSGGSSSGCAALVASREVDMAIGGDTSGSARIPASFCGLVALKPTFGLIPFTGIFGYCWQLDCAGPMTRNVADCAKLLQVISGKDYVDGRQMGTPTTLPKYYKLLSNCCIAPSAGLAGFRIGVLKEGFMSAKQEPRVEHCVRAAIHWMEEMGAEVIEVSCPSHLVIPAEDTAVWGVWSGFTQGENFIRQEVYLNDFKEALLQINTPDQWAKCPPIFQDKMIESHYLQAQYPIAFGLVLNRMNCLYREIDDAFKCCDLMVMPTVACLPPPAEFDAFDPKQQEAINKAGEGLDINTRSYSFSGHPALSLPVGMVKVENPLWTPTTASVPQTVCLPVGMQIVGKKFDEMTMLKVADCFEQSCDWKKNIF